MIYVMESIIPRAWVGCACCGQCFLFLAQSSVFLFSLFSDECFKYILINFFFSSELDWLKVAKELLVGIGGADVVGESCRDYRV